MCDLTEAMRLIAVHSEYGFFAGTRDEALIEKAETALGGLLPPSYREFVQNLGAGSFGSFEVYGVVDEDFDNSAVPNGIWLTLNERSSGFSDDLVILGSTGDGGYYCLEIRGGSESPVFISYPGLSQNREKVAEDFGSFLLDEIREQLKFAGSLK